MPKKYKDSSSEDDTRSEEERPKPKAKESKKETKTKRRLSGYNLFSQKERSKVVKEHPKYKPSQVMTELGKRWRNLDDSQKKRWNTKAQKL